MRATTAMLLRVFVPFAGGYFVSYLFRTVNAVIAPDLTAAVGLSAADLGLLTSVYFLAFALCQLPLGLFLDRYGPRRVEAVLLVLAALGATLFSQGHGMATLLLGRACIGLGVSACLMAAFQAFVLWLPPARLPLANGCMMASGGLGALAATAPVEALLRVMDWRGLFLGLAGLTLLAACSIFLVVPEPRRGVPQATMSAQWRGVLRVLRSPLFWRVAPLTMLGQGTLLSLQGLWAGPWLRDVAHLSRAGIATQLFFLAGAMLAGYLLLGVLSERLQRLGVPLQRVMSWGMAVFLLAQLGLCLGLASMAQVLWPLFGFSGTASILAFALLSQAFPSHLAGRVNTALNLLIFVAAFAAQYGTGALIGLWPATATGGYAVAAYRSAFGVLLGLQALAWLWLQRPLGAADSCAD